MSEDCWLVLRQSHAKIHNVPEKCSLLCMIMINVSDASDYDFVSFIKHDLDLSELKLKNTQCNHFYHWLHLSLT